MSICKKFSMIGEAEMIIHEHCVEGLYMPGPSEIWPDVPETVSVPLHCAALAAAAGTGNTGTPVKKLTGASTAPATGALHGGGGSPLAYEKRMTKPSRVTDESLVKRTSAVEPVLVTLPGPDWPVSTTNSGDVGSAPSNIFTKS
jgi:hypothetical protein